MTQKFRLVTSHLYWWPVEVLVPDPDRAGETVTQSLDIQFEALPADEVSKIEPDPDEKDPFVREHALLFRVCKNWRGVVADDDKTPIAFSREDLRLALQMPWTRTAVYVAYGRSLAGGEARRKN